MKQMRTHNDIKQCQHTERKRLMKNNKRKVITAILLAVLMVLPLGTGASAANTVDPDSDTGSISLTLQTRGGTKVKDVEISIYQVGTGVIQESNLLFELIEALDEVDAPLNGLTAAKTQESAAALWEAIQKMEDQSGLPVGKSAKTDENGKVKFDDLPVGTYLVVQTSRSSRYRDITPFLIALPMMNEDAPAWVFAVDATPKVQTRPTNPPPTDPEDPDPVVPPDEPEPDDPGDDNPPPPVDIDDTDVPGGDDPGLPDPDEGDIEIIDPDVPQGNLPETGMVQWPVPVLAILGLALLGMGWISERKRRLEGR